MNESSLTPPAPRAPSIEPVGDVSAIDMLRLILPMAKGYAFDHAVGCNYDLIKSAEKLLAAPASAGVEEFPLPTPAFHGVRRGGLLREDGWTEEQVRDVLRSYSASLGLQGSGT